MKKTHVVSVGLQKPAQAPAGTVQSVNWMKPTTKQQSTSSQPAWSRYIDSRLRQFGTR